MFNLDVLFKPLAPDPLAPRQTDAKKADLAWAFSDMAPRRTLYRIPFMAPTIPPAETMPGSDKLEEIDNALEYFAQRGITEVSVQEKAMGSRVTFSVDLTRDGSYHGVFTRKGRDILTFREPRLVEFVTRILTRLEQWCVENDHTRVVLDGELLPWNALGERLIEGEYGAAFDAAEQMAERATAALRNSLAPVPDGMIDAFDVLASGAKVCNDQLSNYIDPEKKFRYVLFGVPKVDSAVFFPCRIPAERGYIDQISKYLEDLGVVPVRSLCLPIDANRLEVSKIDARAFADEIEARGGEGVVIKPYATATGFIDWAEYRSSSGHHLLPAIKVRNPSYLQIIYGPGYREPKNFELVSKRNIGRKAYTSKVQTYYAVRALSAKTDQERMCFILRSHAENSNEGDPRL